MLVIYALGHRDNLGNHSLDLEPCGSCHPAKSVIELFARQTRSVFVPVELAALDDRSKSYLDPPLFLPAEWPHVVHSPVQIVGLAGPGSTRRRAGTCALLGLQFTDLSSLLREKLFNRFVLVAGYSSKAYLRLITSLLRRFRLLRLFMSGARLLCESLAQEKIKHLPR